MTKSEQALTTFAPAFQPQTSSFCTRSKPGRFTQKAPRLPQTHLIYQFAGIRSCIFSREENKETGLLAVLPPPSFRQRHDAPSGLGGDPDGLEIRVRVRRRNKVQHFRVLGQQAPVILSRHGREVVDVAPVVVEYAQPCVLEVKGQLGVVVLKAAELHSRGGLDDGLGGAAQEHIHLFTVPRAELLTGHHALDVFAVSEKHTSLYRSEDNAAVDAVVDCDGGRVVQHVDVAVFTLLNDKLLAVQFSRQAAHSDVFESGQHVIFGVNLGINKYIQTISLE